MRLYRYVKHAHYVKLWLGAALLAAALAGCGPSTPSSQPTSPAQPTAEPGATALPTSGTAQPKPSPAVTPKPQSTDTTSTPVPQPVIGFNPKSGGPGTVVDVFGSGYAPGQPVKVRLGLPNPTGDVLASAFPGADGRWSARLTIPDRLPSGDPITTKDMFLVAMDDANIALASAPFGFAPPQGPTHADARETVRELLSAWAHGTPEQIGGLLAKNLRDQVAAGHPYFEVLSLHSTPLGSFDVRDPAPSEVMIVPATLHYDGYEEERTYQLVVEDDRWKIAGTALAQAPLPAVPADPADAVKLFLRTAQSDRSLRHNRASYYLGGSLRDQVANGQIAGVSQILLEQNPFFSFRINRSFADGQDNTYVETTLFYGDGAEVKRLSTVSNREEGIWRIFKVTIAGGVGDPADNFPGPGWQVFNQGDFNGDGLVETLFYKEASLTPVDRFVDPDLNQRSFVVGAIMVAQAGAEGPRAMLTVDNDSIRADKVLGRFRSDASQEGPAAFLFALDPNTDSVFKLLPLKADGSAYTQAEGINWSAKANAYRIVGPHGGE